MKFLTLSSRMNWWEKRNWTQFNYVVCSSNYKGFDLVGLDYNIRYCLFREIENNSFDSMWCTMAWFDIYGKINFCICKENINLPTKIFSQQLFLRYFDPFSQKKKKKHILTSTNQRLLILSKH